jgi:hypothetical protein
VLCNVVCNAQQIAYFFYFLLHDVSKRYTGPTPTAKSGQNKHGHPRGLRWFARYNVHWELPYKATDPVRRPPGKPVNAAIGYQCNVHWADQLTSHRSARPEQMCTASSAQSTSHWFAQHPCTRLPSESTGGVGYKVIMHCPQIYSGHLTCTACTASLLQSSCHALHQAQYILRMVSVPLDTFTCYIRSYNPIRAYLCCTCLVRTAHSLFVTVSSCTASACTSCI